MKKAVCVYIFSLIVFVIVSQSMLANKCTSNLQCSTPDNPSLPTLLNITFTKHIIDSSFDYAFSVYACDIDSDDDCDILGAEKDGDMVAWWRNDGGTPLQWTKFVIDNHFDGATSVFPADIDGDSDIDVVGAAWHAEQIAWWRNDGGTPLQWTKFVIRTDFDFAHEVFCCDLDVDGDIDVLGASSDDNQIAWWRNEGGTPLRWTEQIIDNGFHGAKSIRVADIDNDNVLDVVGAAIFDNSIVWWHNTNSDPIIWEKHIITDDFQGAHRAEVCDMDDDGIIDIVGAAYFGNELAWWHNSGGSPIEWTKHTITTGFNRACIGLPVDLDGDNDIDVVGTAQNANDVAWFRNDGGTPIEWTKIIIDQNFQGAWPGYVTDIDGDGDIDIVAGASFADVLAWYENDLSQHPEKPARPSGPASGKTGNEYTYTSSSIDPEGLQLYYFFDWGDGTDSGLLGPYDSGTECNASHTWGEKGHYEIKVKAKDTNGAESDWSDPLPVSMPRTYENPFHQFIERLFEWFFSTIFKIDI